MMTLTNFEQLPVGNKLEYKVYHATPGRDGTTVGAELKLFIRPNKSWCEMRIEDCGGETQQVALDKMAAWLRRLATGIEERQEISIPM